MPPVTFFSPWFQVTEMGPSKTRSRLEEPGYGIFYLHVYIVYKFTYILTYHKDQPFM